MHTISEKKLLMLKPDEIRLSCHQPRKNFDEYEMKLLTDSISTSGIIEPLAVRKMPDGIYELIAGERRLKAALRAGLRRVPCVLHKTDDETAALYSVIENIQRSNLTVFEEANGINYLINEYALTQSEVAVRLGIAQSTLSNKLRLLRLSNENQERIVSAGLTERHARAILRLPYDKQEEALNYIISEGLTIKQTDDYVYDVLNPVEETEPEKKEEQPPIRKMMIGDVRIFSNSLSKLIDTLQNAGINASTKKYENEKYIEYKVRIKKENLTTDHFKQLKIC